MRELPRQNETNNFCISVLINDEYINPEVIMLIELGKFNYTTVTIVQVGVH